MQIKNINLCRDLFQIIHNIELNQREKLNPVIEINTEIIQEHFNKCGICQNEFKKLYNPMTLINLMKGGF